MRQRLPLLALLAGLLAAAALLAVSKPPASAGPILGSSAPDFEVADLGGQVISLSRLRGQVVLLNFWASWCPDCREETPTLDRLYQRLKAKGFTVLALSVDTGGRPAVMSFVARFNPSFPIALSDSRAQQAYGIYALPASFLIDRGGVIRRIYKGAVNEPEAENDILALVSKS